MTTETTPRPSWANAITTPAASSKPKSIMLYGLPGTRKTSIAGSIALVEGFNKVLYIDVDQGSEVLAQNPLLRHVDILPIDPMDPSAKDKIDSVIKDVTQNNYGYDAVVLDTLDVAQDVAERSFQAQNPNPKDGFWVYRQLGEWTDSTVRRLHTAPHLLGIVTCHSVEQKAESGAYRILPRLSGASKDAVGGIPSIVGYLEYGTHPDTGEKHLLGTFGQSESKITKERYGLPPMIVDPDLPKIYRLINERVGKPAPAQTTTSKED